jgi:hypothetical protein
LRDIGIAPVVALPVGRNLRDHLAVFLSFTRHGHAVEPHLAVERPWLAAQAHSCGRRCSAGV